jgi:glucose-1-phosphate adenylyltransferase
LKDVETDLYVVQDGIVVIKKGAVIPRGFVI